MVQQSLVRQCLLIIEASRSQTHHSRYDPSARVIGPKQRPLPDNTQHSQKTDIYAPDGTRTLNPSNREAANSRLRPRGHWCQLTDILFIYISWQWRNYV